jgi:GDA1/CD39 (nucleoside phosphatase) family
VDYFCFLFLYYIVSDTRVCVRYFPDHRHARVISGEEEAIYGWAAVNFVKGTLIANSEGSGSVRRANLTYGVLEMGGASTQVGFFEPEGDVMANLFKLQIGAAKHWNVYVHSFLYFGVNGGFDRLNAGLVTESAMSKNFTAGSGDAIYNPCLPGGGQYVFTSRIHQLKDGNMLPLSSPDDPAVLEASLYTALMGNPHPMGDFDSCMFRVRKLLRKDSNAWCDFAHDRDCSLAGVYQVRSSRRCVFGLMPLLCLQQYLANIVSFSY